MNDASDDIQTANALRASVVNWLLSFAEVDELSPADALRDMGALDRARYERRLGLLSGALSIGRFNTDFAGLESDIIGERLLDEAYLGSMIRTAPNRSGAETAIVEQESEPADPEERFRRFISAIGLDAREVLVLSGSPDVSLVFSRWGAAVPEVRRHPGRQDLSRFGLAIIGRGQAGHKDFEPWTQLIKSAGKHHGPAMLTTPSSNISGILEYLWTQRASIKRYVDEWRIRAGE